MAMGYIDRFLGEVRSVLFIPYAAVNFSYDDYERKVADAMSAAGITVRSIHHEASPKDAIASARAIIVGGGNTFHLLKTLQELDLIDPIRTKVQLGTPYIGWSAGSNLACPTIRTTNDMPVVEPQNFDALNLISFQINPHFTERTIAGHGGESRLQRLLEYSAVNEYPVVCLPENCGIRMDESGMRLLSAEPVKMIRKGGEITTLHHGMITI